MENKIVDAYTLDTAEIIKLTQTDVNAGLSSDQAQERLDKYGKNIINSDNKVSALKILFHNINNIIVYLLMMAAIVSFIMRDNVEGVAIIVAILVAVLSGFFTELKAQKSIEALQNMVVTNSKVKRNREIIEIPSSDLVIGDILYLEEGDSISADARIIKSVNFATIESALTGESEAVDKNSDIIDRSDIPLGDRTNVVFAGTAATRGNAYAIVTGTGINTEIGRISELLKENKKTATPLEKQLNKLGKALVLISAIVAFIVTIIGIVAGEEIISMIKIGIILAIAAVPESLPAVSTITLAIGMKTMANHNALVKNLPAVETLGSTTVICTDKTGTLTENQMTVSIVSLFNKTYTISGLGYQPDGEFYTQDNKVDAAQESELYSLIMAGVLSSNATIVYQDNDHKVIGDPTEGSLIALGNKAGISKSNLADKGYNRIGEIPFNSEAKFMATAYEITQNHKKIYIKGAPDVLIDMIKSDEDKHKWLTLNDNLAEQGMRVLAIGEIDNYNGDGNESSIREYIDTGINLLGLTGVIDPPREDVMEAIKIAQDAGIRVIMITGDHPKTARIIAEKIGMNNIKEVITGKEINKMDDIELAQAIKTVSIFARVSPENKLQIVRALKIDKEITAMTGDGVNDAPALSGADIGVAMGIRGTEVAKDASDMILTDDKFSTIVKAVSEGRVIFDNIEKFVYFLFSCNFVEIFVVFLAIAFGFSLPILALHILWLNLVVDILPAMSLAYEKGEKDIMKRKPRNPQSAILNKSFATRILTNSFLICLGAFLVFVFSINQGYSLDVARTMTFTTMAFGQLFHIFNVRQKTKFGLDKSVLKNPFLIAALIISAALQLVAVYVPFFNNVMHTTPLDLYKWMYVIMGSLLPTALIQIKRLVYKKKKVAIN